MVTMRILRISTLQIAHLVQIAKTEKTGLFVFI